jgi:benzoyl-CoA-dihydrodiol lyase
MRKFADDTIEYETLSVELDRAARIATILVRGPAAPPPASGDAMMAQGTEFWPLKLARELDDAILHIRLNELDVAAIVFKSSGEPAEVLAYDRFLDANQQHWLVREIRLLWKRVLKRVDLTSRSLVTLIEPGSCFAGTLAELPLASDRSYMLIGGRDGDNKPPASIALADANFGPYPMANGLTRLSSRFLAAPGDLDRVKAERGKMIDAETRSTISIGRMKCGCSLRSAPASRPTRSPGSRRICASPGRRPWNRKSSRG